MKEEKSESSYKTSLAAWLLESLDEQLLQTIAGDLCIVREQHRDGTLVYVFEDYTTLTYNGSICYAGKLASRFPIV